VNGGKRITTVYPLPEDEEKKKKNGRKMKYGRTKLEQEVARCHEDGDNRR